MDATTVEPMPKAGFLDKFFHRIAGVDEDVLRVCPPGDWGNVRAVAEIMICVWIYQTALFSIIAHRLFAAPGDIRPELILISMFLATFIMLIDSYMVMRSGWHLSGIEELKRGGIDVSGGMAARIKAGIFLAVRIFLSICIAQLTAIFLGILIFWSDIAPRIQSNYVQANSNLIAATTKQVDAEIKRAGDDLNAESSQEAALASQVNALRQDQIDPSANRPEIQLAGQEVAQLLSQKLKADEALQSAETFASAELAGIRATAENSGIPGDGPRRRAAMEAVANAKSHAAQISAALDAARNRIDGLRRQSVSSSDTTKQQSQSELPRFEAALAAEEGKVQSLRDELARRTEHREEAIRSAVEAAPNHIPAESGLLSQIAALEHIAQADAKIAAVIILIDLTSFGFELAAVLAKVTSFVPTTYAALLARDAYMRVVRLVDGMMAELNRKSGGAESEIGPVVKATHEQPSPREESATPGSDPFAKLNEASPVAQKRPRGRPPKTPFGGQDGNPFPFGDDLAAHES